MTKKDLERIDGLERVQIEIAHDIDKTMVHFKLLTTFVGAVAVIIFSFIIFIIDLQFQNKHDHKTKSTDIESITSNSERSSEENVITEKKPSESLHF